MVYKVKDLGMVYNEKHKQAIYRWREKNRDQFRAYKNGWERYMREAAKFRNILIADPSQDKPMVKPTPAYNESTKKSIYKWRENNKVKFNEYMRDWQRYRKEATVFRNILIESLDPPPFVESSVNSTVNQFFYGSAAKRT